MNDYSAMPEQTSGRTEIASVEAPESALAKEDLSTGTTEQHEVGASGGLPWYVANKFGYRNNKTGPGRHLAPHESYVLDVLKYGQQYAAAFTPKEGNSEYETALDHVGLMRSLIEVRNDFDIDDDEAAAIKMEAKDILRGLRTRYLLALKIAGGAQCDRVYAIEHAQLNDWDINRTTENEYFMRQGNTRDVWARKAAWYAFTLDHLVTEFNASGINLNLEGGIRQALYSDARDAKQRLEAPPVVPNAAGTEQQRGLAETLAA